MEVELVARHAVEIIHAPDTGSIPRPIQLEAYQRVRDLMTDIGRPGKGGRNTRIPQGFETEATAELRRRLGTPTVKRQGKAELQLWEMDPDGRGVVAARLSTEDVKKGETVMAQIHGSLELCKELDLKPRFILVATRQNGSAKLTDRLDLMFVLEAVRRKMVDWVMYREVDRLSRSVAVGDEFYDFLEETGTDLYLTVYRKRIDWEVDKFLLHIQGGAADFEKRTTGRRIFSAHERRRLIPGRGWPGARKFGFRAGPDGYPEVDPEQWGFVERIHYDYSSIGEHGRGSLRMLKEHMESLGCPFGVEQLRKILREPVYVTGEWGSTVHGIYYPGRKIEIPRPIPAEVQAKNIQLLDNTRGKYSATKFGTFLLNNIPVYHARCMHIEVKRKQPNNKSDMTVPRMRGRTYSDERRARRPHVYRHVPKTPQCCRGYTVPAEALESAVIEALLDLADSEPLQLAYTTAARPENDLINGVEDTDILKQRIDRLKSNRRKLRRDLADEAANGSIDGLRPYETALEVIEAEIQQLQNRVAIASAKRSSTGEKDMNLRQALKDILDLKDDSSKEQRQKRVALTGALLSKVIIHDTDDGVEVELFGHLIPEGQAMAPVQLRNHFDEAVSSCRTLSTKLIPSGRSATSWEIFGEPLPAWKSPRLKVDTLPFGRLSINTAKAAIRWAADHSRHGRLFARVGDRPSPYNEARRAWPQLPKPQAITDVLSGTGIDRNSLIRTALGTEKALRQGRVTPKGEDELRLVVRWALEDGFTLDAGWGYRWDIFARERHYLWCYEALSKASRRIDISFSHLAHLVSGELGITYKPLEEGHIEHVVLDSGSSVNELLRSCVTTKFLCRKPGIYGQKLVKQRVSGELLGLAIPGRLGNFYPRWQFDEKWAPYPVVSRLIEIIKRRQATAFELHTLMISSVSFQQQKRDLWQLCTTPDHWDWLESYVDSNLRKVAQKRRVEDG